MLNIYYLLTYLAWIGCYSTSKLQLIGCLWMKFNNKLQWEDERIRSQWNLLIFIYYSLKELVVCFAFQNTKLIVVVSNFTHLVQWWLTVEDSCVRIPLLLWTWTNQMAVQEFKSRFNIDILETKYIFLMFEYMTHDLLSDRKKETPNYARLLEQIRKWNNEGTRKAGVESVPWADRRTESNSGSEERHPRDVENTRRNIATESRNTFDRKYINGEGEHLSIFTIKHKCLSTSNALTRLSLGRLLYGEESTHKGQTWKWHCLGTNKDHVTTALC